MYPHHEVDSHLASATRAQQPNDERNVVVLNQRLWFDRFMTYGSRVWGDPCPACGYSWATTYDEALELIAGAGARYGELIRGREEMSMLKPAQGTWSPSGYVWHLSDWFRIQGQRIYMIASDPLYRWVQLGFDPTKLGEVFKYDELPPTAGLWALQKAADLFVEAAADADTALVFDPGQGDSWTVGELVVWVAHEVVHHDKDIRDGLEAIAARQQA